MTVWNGKLMKENELSRPARIFIGLAMVVLIAATARSGVANALGGVVTRPWALGLVPLGVVGILLGRSFTRLGWFVIALGLLLSFA